MVESLETTPNLTEYGTRATIEGTLSNAGDGGFRTECGDFLARCNVCHLPHGISAVLKLVAMQSETLLGAYSSECGWQPFAGSVGKGHHMHLYNTDNRVPLRSQWR